MCILFIYIYIHTLYLPYMLYMYYTYIYTLYILFIIYIYITYALYIYMYYICIYIYIDEKSGKHLKIETSLFTMLSLFSLNFYFAPSL